MHQAQRFTRIVGAPMSIGQSVRDIATDEQRQVRRQPIILLGEKTQRAPQIALERIPELNGRWEDGAFVESEAINLGMAIALRKGGLVAPALFDANTLDLAELMRAFRDLVTRARTQKLRASELSGPTMTITNLGEQGVEVVYPVIYPPQVAIAGFGSVVERPWVVDGQLEVRRVVVASLAADHRVSDGRRGGLFLGTVNELLQRPEAL